MHETLLKTVTVGVVTGLFVYWLTSRHHADCAGKNTNPRNYSLLLGDVRRVNGTPSCFCDNAPLICGTKNSPVLLASDYLPCGGWNTPQHAPAISEWNLGVSLQLSCKGLDGNVYRTETATSFPHGVSGPDTAAQSAKITGGQLSCNPCVAAQVDCTEIV